VNPLILIPNRMQPCPRNSNFGKSLTGSRDRRHLQKLCSGRPVRPPKFKKQSRARKPFFPVKEI